MIFKHDFSVIVCCFNSSKRLKRTLEHLSVQKTVGLSSELIIVDNNSSDDTEKAALKYWIELGEPYCLKIVKEPSPGLSFARQTGVANAMGKYIIFCDDDNWLQDDYLEKSYNFMELHPEVGALGGKGIAVSSMGFPDWFTTFQGAYAVGVQNIESAIVNSRGFVWGAGMVVRNQELVSLFNSGFTSLLTDRKGVDLSSGGDAEICKWFLLVGKDLYYSNQLVFKHYIEADRLSLEYFKGLNNGFFYSGRVLNIYDTIIKYGNIISQINKKNKIVFFKIVSMFLKLVVNRSGVNIFIFLEMVNNTPFTFHDETKKILKSRKFFIENR
jgi:glycosyltransferase involved in cell wall biosynthesis